MSTTQVVTVRGEDRLAATLHRAADDIGELEAARDATGRLVQQRAVARTPKVTGALAGSLRVEADGPTVAVASGLVYAPVIHFGWAAHGISPHPFLIPAAVDSVPVFLGYYEADAQRALSHVKGA